jgi:hypothetical protein
MPDQKEGAQLVVTPGRLIEPSTRPLQLTAQVRFAAERAREVLLHPSLACRIRAGKAEK